VPAHTVYQTAPPFGGAAERAQVPPVDGVTMIESGAMLVWLADRFPERGMAPALDAPERALYLQWIFYNATQLEPPLERFWKEHDVAQRDLFDTAARVVTAALGDGRPYLCGERFGTADVAIASVIGWARALGALDAHPALADYGRRCGGRPAAKRARAD
jgi:glutathione S-transferase